MVLVISLGGISNRFLSEYHSTLLLLLREAFKKKCENVTLFFGSERSLRSANVGLSIASLNVLKMLTPHFIQLSTFNAILTIKMLPEVPLEIVTKIGIR